MNSYELPNIIQSLLNYNLELRNQKRDNVKNCIPPKLWTEQFCTIRVDVGRQSGKSWYCAMSCDDSGVIITTNRCLSTLHISDRAICWKDINRITQDSLNSIKYVFIEEPSFIGDLDDIYRYFTRDGIERTFILIGA